MHTFMDAKLMAKLLRQALAERGLDVSHSDSLEVVARQFGVANWNILSAKIDAASGADDRVLAGWSKSGTRTKNYLIDVDQAQHAAIIASRPGVEADLSEADFCTLMQSVDATAWRGKRARLRCELKAIDVDGGVTAWLRVDGPAGSLRFENLERYQHNGPLRGTTDWTTRSIVLDVPNDATTLNFGFYLKGTGRGLARAMDLEEVDGTTPLNTPDAGALAKPTNMDFMSLS
jgi:hypothetical protein